MAHICMLILFTIMIVVTINTIIPYPIRILERWLVAIGIIIITGYPVVLLVQYFNPAFNIQISW